MTAALPPDWVLLADIGGTNARFALARPGGIPERIETLPVAAHGSLEEAATAYLAAHGGGARPVRAALAVAAPVTGDAVALTNHPWRFSQRALAGALGVTSVSVRNDFEALALALPHLQPGDLRPLGGGSGGGDAVVHAPRAVLGPGTGLGMAILVWSGGAWTAVAGEGGHVDFGPADDAEVELLRALLREFGHASVERVLCGPGLVTLYAAAAARGGLSAPVDATPESVAAAANGGEAVAVAAVNAFSALLGAVAGDLALTAGARGGIYVAGGVVGALGTAFDAAGFRRRFEAKGRLAPYLAPIPAWHILHPNPALLGLARTAEQPA